MLRGDAPDILMRIVADNRLLAEEAEASRAAWEREALLQPPAIGFRGALARAEGLAIIAEVKRASPSAGVIAAGFDPAAIAAEYEDSGADAVSVLTEPFHFHGAPDHFRAIRPRCSLPMLRKDFIVCHGQVAQARAWGADAFLLIAALLDAEALRRLAAYGSSLGMDALVEAHDEAEIDRAVDSGASLIGVNNRDLRTFRVDLAVTERLAPRVPPDRLLVGESGVRSPADAARLRAAGCRALLVGESLMRSAGGRRLLLQSLKNPDARALPTS